MDRSKNTYDAIASKEQMLAIVSHDIKNPLSAIQLETQLLIKAADRNGKSLFSEEVKIQAGRILKTTERMKHLISDLLEKNKTESGLFQLQKQEVDLKKLLQDVLDSIRPLLREKDLTLKMSVSEPDTFLFLDRNKMIQVLSNLLNNSIKFTPKGGVIHLMMEGHPDGHVFQVSDTGPGIKEEDLPFVFDKYWTGGCAGTGLGLFICKTIIEAHKGQISATNLPHGGASFTFKLPKCSQEMLKNIYVVDDDEDLRDVICWALEKEGYVLHSFPNPILALQNLIQFKHQPQLFLVDFHMDEMKGTDFIQKKNELGLTHCPVIMISATPREIDGKISTDLYREVITKPLDLTGLVTNIKSILG